MDIRYLVFIFIIDLLIMYIQFILYLALIFSIYNFFFIEIFYIILN